MGPNEAEAGTKSSKGLSELDESHETLGKCELFVLSSIRGRVCLSELCGTFRKWMSPDRVLLRDNFTAR